MRRRQTQRVKKLPLSRKTLHLMGIKAAALTPQEIAEMPQQINDGYDDALDEMTKAANKYIDDVLQPVADFVLACKQSNSQTAKDVAAGFPTEVPKVTPDESALGNLWNNYANPLNSFCKLVRATFNLAPDAFNDF